MLEDLLARLSLPNLHPAVVHFPIALLPAALAFDIASLLFSNHRDWLSRGAAALYAGAAVAAAAAFWAGRRAADSLIDVPAAVQVRIGEHSDWGTYSLWLVTAMAAVRLVVAWRDPDAEHAASRALPIAGGLAAVAMLFYTADLGGGLVFRHGVAVARQEERAPTAATPAGAVGADTPADAGPPSQRLHRGEDGVVTWAPLPQDGAALGSLLRPAAGSSLTPVTWIEPGPQARRGLALEVKGRTLLVLPGSFDDVQVEAELELGELDGVVGLAHHVRGARQAGLFTVAAPAGTYALQTLRGDDSETLDEERRDLPAGPLRLAVTAAGRHLRGLVDGATVVHGHEPALPAGGCGIYLDGHGQVRVVSLRIEPLSD